jgi:hypothetical protein
MSRITYAATAGRKGRGWRWCQTVVRARSDICCWCGHPGARDVNHDLGLAQARALGLANDPGYCSPIHGATSGCPLCPRRYSRKVGRYVRRNCNGELGARPLAQALAQRSQGDRVW